MFMDAWAQVQLGGLVQRGQDPDLDCHFRLPARGHRKKKRLGIHPDLYTILQILSVHPFEKAPLAQVFSEGGYTPENTHIHNQMLFFDL
jgi:hypothetical protein